MNGSHHRRERRDEFARAALLGLLANPNIVPSHNGVDMPATVRYAECAVEFADALIAELDKVPVK